MDAAALDQGECEIPPWLRLFWKTAIRGIKNKESDQTKRLAHVHVQDSIYSITRGRIKPRKHILLGLVTKSLTGSEKMTTILNRLGYCNSYSNVSQMETLAAYTAIATKRLCPTGIIPTAVLPSAVAWDNFDS